jgi:hypothetical protein
MMTRRTAGDLAELTVGAFHRQNPRLAIEPQQRNHDPRRCCAVEQHDLEEPVKPAANQGRLRRRCHMRGQSPPADRALPHYQVDQPAYRFLPCRRQPDTA